MYKPVQREEVLSRQVARQMEDLYIRGELQAGNRLPPERELCETFSVSRTVIREAIQVLSAKGMLKSQSGSGTYVQAVELETLEKMMNLYAASRLDGQAVIHAFEFRVVLELQVVRLAAERRTAENIKKLEAVLYEMEMSLDDPEAYSSLDAAFHLEIARASQNPWFETFLKAGSALIRQIISYSNVIPGRPAESLKAHRAVYSAIEQKNQDAAEARMYEHLDLYRSISLSMAEQDRETSM